MGKKEQKIDAIRMVQTDIGLALSRMKYEINT